VCGLLFMGPPNQGVYSRLTPKSLHGQFGSINSISQAVGRVLGPLFGGLSLSFAHHTYFFTGLLALSLFVAIWGYLNRADISGYEKDGELTALLNKKETDLEDLERGLLDEGGGGDDDQRRDSDILPPQKTHSLISSSSLNDDNEFGFSQDGSEHLDEEDLRILRFTYSYEEFEGEEEDL